MITDSATLVLFAIRSAFRLGNEARQAFVDSTRKRELTLPLPHFFTGTNEFDAKQFFEEPTLGKKYVDGYVWEGENVPGLPRVAELLARFTALAADEKRELIDAHTKYFNLSEVESRVHRFTTGDLVTAEEVYALFTIQQWRRGTDPTPTTLHRMAGTFVEIGIDYAATDPNLFDRNSGRGKALLGFLSGLQQVTFTQGDPAELPSRLFVVAMETISSQPALFSGDPKVQELVQVTTTVLSQDVNNRIRQIQEDPLWDPIEKRAARLATADWAELVFRSTLTSGGRLVLENPDRYLGIRQPGQQAMITQVGQALLGLVLDDPAGLRHLISRSGLEKLLQSALGVLGDHPELLEGVGLEGLRTLLSQLAEDVSQIDGVLSRDMLPDLARLTLEKTAENLDLFWPERADHPEQNLLIRVVRTTLTALSASPPNGATWKLQFSQPQLFSLVEMIVGELTANPGCWIDATGNWRGTLDALLESVLGVVRAHADQRLSPALAADLLREALRAAIARKEFLDELPGGKVAVAALLETILDAVLDQDLELAAAWQVVRNEAIRGITHVALAVLAKYPLDANAVQRLASVLDRQLAALSKDKLFDLTAFEKALVRKFKPSTSNT